MSSFNKENVIQRKSENLRDEVIKRKGKVFIQYNTSSRENLRVESS